MKTLILLPLLLVFISPFQNPSTSAEVSGVTVLSFKWSRTRQTARVADPAATGPASPAPAMIAQNKNFQRNARINDPAGVRDPNQDTLDGRSAAMEKMVQDSRAPTAEPVNAFAYLVKIHNARRSAIEVLFWEYQFIDPSNPANVTRRQFLCGANIKPDKDKELLATSLLGPSDVISAQTFSNADAAFPEKVWVNRVEYADGSIWQRKDWNFAEIKLTFQHAVSTRWAVGEMCRGL